MVVTALTYHGTEARAAGIICDAISTLASCHEVCHAERQALGQLGACQDTLTYPILFLVVLCMTSQ